MKIETELKQELISAGWTPPPIKKPVDLSVLINSGIDCEFTDRLSALPYRGFLKGISADREKPYCTHAYKTDWQYCKPEMNYWFCYQNFGNLYSVANKIRFAGFEVEFDRNTNFRITGLQDGYCWPWEV